MKKLINCIYLTIVIITILGNIVSANSKKIYLIDLKKDIGSTTWLYIQNGFNEAKSFNSDIILIEMNTYGGEVLYADSIRTQILNSKIPVYVFVNNNAASAGALIAIACKGIYMRKGASIGAATVVNQNAEKMPDKYQSYMRATMRATAEAHGKDTIINGTDTTFKWKRDPLIAEAMVDERTVISGIDDSAKILTLTALEAVKYNYCEGITENIDELITKQLNIKDFELIKYEPTSWENLKGFLMSSVLQGILIMLIIGGIYFELQTPGIGFPLGVAITAAVLYFAPLYMDGLAANWEILVFIVGIVLVALELLVIPGFGVAGISGIGMIILGLTLSLLDNVNFDFENVEVTSTRKALLTVTSGFILAFALVIYLSSKIGTKGIFRKMALKTSLKNADGYVGVTVLDEDLLQKTGIAHTVLRSAGKVKIADKVYDAISIEGFIEKGEKVKVVKFQTGQLYVEKL